MQVLQSPPPSLLQQREVNLSNKSDQLPWKVLKYYFFCRHCSKSGILFIRWIGKHWKKYSRGFNLDVLSQLAGPGIITAKLCLMACKKFLALDGYPVVVEDLSCTETPLCFTPQLNFYPLLSQSTPFWRVMVAIMFSIFSVPWLRSSSVQ